MLTLPPPPPPIARLELIVGPMFSGKTTEMVRRIIRHRIARRRCLILKWAKDVRPGEDIGTMKTHAADKEACFRVQSLDERKWGTSDFDVIGVDDGQFLDADLVRFCRALVDDYGKIVIVSALDSDFRREPFAHVCLLMAHADKTKKLSAICTVCGDEAPFSFKKDRTPGGPVIDVGGSEKYEARCRRCHKRGCQIN